VKGKSRTVINKATGESSIKTGPDRFLYQCLNPECKRYQFAATTGTIFSDTKLPLSIWMQAIALMCTAKKGIAAKQMERTMGVSYKTAWYLNHRIRKAMEDGFDGLLTGTVEIDETYVGGRYDKRRSRAKYDKEPVFGIVERGGKARTFHMRGMTLKTVVEKIKANVSIEADAIHTDDGKFYGTAAGCIKSHKHEVVKTPGRTNGYAAMFTPGRLTATGAF
jgi:hypothetical protein